MLVVAEVQVTIIHHTVVEVSAEAETETEHRVKMEPAVAAVVPTAPRLRVVGPIASGDRRCQVPLPKDCL